MTGNGYVFKMGQCLQISSESCILNFLKRAVGLFVYVLSIMCGKNLKIVLQR